jgi:hypothetical protein
MSRWLVAACDRMRGQDPVVAKARYGTLPQWRT